MSQVKPLILLLRSFSTWVSKISTDIYKQKTNFHIISIPSSELLLLITAWLGVRLRCLPRRLRLRCDPPDKGGASALDTDSIWRVIIQYQSIFTCSTIIFNGFCFCLKKHYRQIYVVANFKWEIFKYILSST